jgi:hypothetical protein
MHIRPELLFLFSGSTLEYVYVVKQPERRGDISTRGVAGDDFYHCLLNSPGFYQNPFIKGLLKRYEEAVRSLDRAPAIAGTRVTTLLETTAR